MNSNRTVLAMLIGLFLSMLVLTSCDNNDSPVEEVGDSVEELGEDIQEAAEDTQREIEDATD